MDDNYRFLSWFVDGYGWARMCPPAALLLLASLPLFLDAGLPLILAYTFLPAYMVHQYEEHAHGAFAAFANSRIAHGREMLTRAGVFWISVLGVWVVFVVLFYLAGYVAVGFALGAVYATIMNGITHALARAVSRSYNPGLYTSLALFLPWGVFVLVYFNLAVLTDSVLLYNAVGLLVGIGLHVAIMGFLLRRRARLQAAGTTRSDT